MTQELAAPLFELTDLHFRYLRRPPGADEHAPWLLRGVSLAVRPGDRVGIIGDNGTGKSTLLKLALGLERPTSGSVRLFGEPVTWHRHYAQLGYVGDPAHSGEELGLPTGLRVRDLVRCYRALFAASGTPVRTRRLAAFLGIDRLLERWVGDLSTGERKRLMTFLALAKDPLLLLMDEPLDGLDREMRDRVESLLVGFAARRDRAVVYISHNVAELAAVAGDVYRLSEGTLLRASPIIFSAVYDRGGVETRQRHSAGQVEAAVARAIREAGEAGVAFGMRLSRDGVEAER